MTNGKKLFAGLGVAAILFTGIGMYHLWNNDKVASIVQLDVNPSIELQVDDDGDVIRTRAINTDGEKVLEGMKLKGADADTAVNAIVGALLRHGYIDEIANSILLTVEDEDTVRGNKLKEELTEEINEILGATEIHASILSQNMEETNLTKQENISEGKATLIENIVEVNEAYKPEELAELSVNDLNLILSNSKNKVDNVEKTGEAAEAEYIGRDKAKEKAFSNAGVKKDQVRELKVDMDYEYKKMVYEVDFACGEYEYDYVIDALNGEVLHSHREYDDDHVKPPVKEEQISGKKAKSIALSHAGMKESEVSRLKVEQDIDDGRIEYEVEFQVGNKEYEYKIHGGDGRILDYDIEVEDRD